jgi:uncharacterized protein (DUF1697 family)
MPHFAAFLRAINVGGTAVIKMDELRRQFEGVGFTNVKTLIASGNVVFDSNLSKAAVTKLIATIGFTAFVRTHAEVQRIAELVPFADMGAEGNVLYVAFLEKKPGAEAEKKLLALANPIDAFHVRGTEAYWLRRRNMGESKLAANFLEKALGQKATLRNVNTIRRIAAMG